MGFFGGGQEEAGVPRENPQTRRENMLTPHRQAPAGNWTWNLEPSCCEVTVLTTTPPCSPGNGWMDGWMDRWIDGWMDGWMDGWIDG